jgi:hypothetical protein
MPRRRKANPKKRTALVKPPPDVQAAGDAVYVRVPLAPEDAATIRGHVETGLELVERGRTLFESIAGFLNDVDRTARRFRGR